MKTNFNFVETYSLRQFAKLTGASSLVPHKLDTGTVFMVFGPGKEDVTYISKKVQARDLIVEEPVVSRVEITDEDTGEIRKAWLFHDAADNQGGGRATKLDMVFNLNDY